ncbi:uncharacterized protein VTP21DRAFT_2531 [Calcarisporiella thermophila]|uniref:uncharacterized protein n=1 Tax=Calcarisporiella thermophila TaxID=911321 RepID=UPI0037431F34
MSRYEIHYFNLHARGELPRFILEYSKADYEDVVIEDWDDEAPEKSEWLNTLKEETPLGYIPVLVEHKNGQEFK